MILGKPGSLRRGAVAVVVVAALCLFAFTIDRDATAASQDSQLVGPSFAESRGVSKAPPPQPINWDKVTQEATDLLSKYIQINTTNPPGNEIVAARLRGIGKHTKSIILLSHMDVVPANPKEWEVPPFSGTVKDGKIWGRGAIDDKGAGVVELMAMLAIKRAGILLNRDVIFI